MALLALTLLRYYDCEDNCTFWASQPLHLLLHVQMNKIVLLSGLPLSTFYFHLLFKTNIAIAYHESPIAHDFTLSSQAMARRQVKTEKLKSLFVMISKCAILSQ